MNENVHNLSRSKIFRDVKFDFGKRWSHFLIAFNCNPKDGLKKWKMKTVEIMNGVIYSSCKIV